MKALLIHNLQAGQRDRRREVAAAASRLSSAGWQVELASTTRIEEGERLCRMAVENGVDSVVVAGGDGSLNVAIQALADPNPEVQRPALGVLPCGTGNVWAREMHVPLDIPGATDVLLSGETARVDLGEANGRYFLCVASVGFDASVTRGIDQRAKRRLGMLAYVIAAAAEALRLRGEEVIISADGKASRQRVLMVLANNTRLYGGGIQMAPNALADDGLLDVRVFRGHGLAAAARHAINVLLVRQLRDPAMDFFQCSSVSLESLASLPVQLDGDYFGTTPVTFRAVPRAVRVIIPPGRHPQFRAIQR